MLHTMCALATAILQNMAFTNIPHSIRSLSQFPIPRRDSLMTFPPVVLEFDASAFAAILL